MLLEHEPQVAQPSAAARPSEAQRVQEKLRRLGALETTHVVLGVTVLAALSVRAVFVAEESIEAMATALAAVLAFSYLAAAFHFRAGQSLLRKDLSGLTLDEERLRERADGEHDAAEHEPRSGGPYRSNPPARRETDARIRESAMRWRRFALVLLVVLASVLLVSVPMVAHVLTQLPHKAVRLH